MNLAQRQAVIARYLAALRAVGDVTVGDARLRDVLRRDNTDLWSASELRESSLWRDATLPDQINALIDEEHVGDNSHEAPRGVRWRAIVAWLRSLVHVARRSGSMSLDTDIVFVEYWPTTTTTEKRNQPEWSSPYFRALPDVMRDAGYSVGFVHLHADGPVTNPPKQVQKSINALNAAGRRHVLFADYHGVSAWWKAFRTWLKIIRRAPTPEMVGARAVGHAGASLLWKWWSSKYARSVFGSHAVRSCLLSEFSRRLVTGSRRTKLWIVAFEGQSWESCLTRHLDAAGATWIPYLHTMMRPWDLRAHTYLSEVAPKWLAVHGQHDHEELKIHGVPIREVEALRYQQLATPSVAGPDGIASTTPSLHRWLVVGGADCDASARQLAELIDAARSNGIEREFVVKWHPQCRRPDDLAGTNIEWTSRPLHEIAHTVNAALMVGSAAPLDTYLAGVPSCSLSEPSGLSMTPLEEDDFFHLAVDAVDAVRWLASADQRRNAQPPVSRYFHLDNRLSRWRTFISDTMSALK